MMERTLIGSRKKAGWTVLATVCLVLVLAVSGHAETGSSKNTQKEVHGKATAAASITEKGGGVPVITLGDKFYDVAMPDKDHIWAVGYFGAIVHSSDGGKQWSRQDSGTKEALLGVSFTDFRQGIAVGNDNTLLNTSDGGKTWNPGTCPDLNRKFLRVQLIDAREGFAVGEFGTIVHTGDGGKTWEKLPFDEDVILNDLVFLNPRQGWVAGEFETILYTTDGGKTFEKQRGDQLGEIFGITFRDSQHGVAAGTDGKILITANGGESWEEIQNASGDTLLKVRYLDSMLLAVGLRGSVVTSADDGQTWSKVNIPGHYSWLSGLAVADGVSIAVGDVGNIISSGNDGKTWTRLWQSSYESGMALAAKE